MSFFGNWFKVHFSPRDRCAFLRDFPIFQNLSSFELNLLVNILHKRIYKAQEEIFTAGNPLELAYLIQSGEIRVLGSLGTGKETLLKGKDCLGIIDMFYEQNRSSSAIAQKESVLWALSKTELEDFIRKNPKTGIRILKNICAYLSRYLVSNVHQE